MFRKVLKKIKKIIKKKLLRTKQFGLQMNFLLFEQRKMKKAEVVFFFPFYHTGGAELVHLNIVKALANKNNCVLFTGKSASNNFLSEFGKSANTIDLKKYLSSDFTRKKIAFLINNNKVISVFGCNCTFFYDVLPYLNESVQKIDLIHAFSTPEYGIEQVSINSIDYLDKRVVINENTRRDLIKQYESVGIKPNYLERIIKIENGIYFESLKKSLKENKKIRVGFVGRWSTEKRPELYLKIAKKIKEKALDIEFVIVGSEMEDKVSEIQDSGVKFLGEIKDKEKLDELYSSINILLVTSYREGFPMVIMEAMANGVVPISTNVGGISEHIENFENGILIDNHENDDVIINDFCNQIENLLTNKEQLKAIAIRSYLYASLHFRIEKFNQNYLNLLVHGS